MLITRECDYAVRVVRALAGEERLCVNDICKKEDLTPAFAYKILKKLENVGILQSFRGSQGGYAIKRPLNKLTLWDIYITVDPTFYVAACMNTQTSCVRNQKESVCKVHGELSRIQDVLQFELSARSLEDILK